MTKKVDIILAILPFMDPYILTGPAILKSALNKSNITSKVMDWNLDIWKKCKDFYATSNYLYLYARTYGFDNPDMKKFLTKNLDGVLNNWINQLKEYDFEWLGLSLYSYKVYSIIYILCDKIRKELPHIKIIIGGNAVVQPIHNIADDLLKKNLIDYYVVGDGEDALISILKNEPNVFGVNNLDQIIQMDDINIIPDYSDYLINEYPLFNYDTTFFYIIGSRGCYNNCKFCQNKAKKYILRNPQNIVDEIIDLNKKYNCLHFAFADAMTNGVPKHIIKLAKLLKESKLNITWESFWKCRSKKVLNEEAYQIIGESGCKQLMIGIESGSPRVRNEMNKKLNIEDLYFIIEQCEKNNIEVLLLFIVGYYTETQDDFQQTLDLLTNVSKITKKVKVNSGPTFIPPHYNWMNLKRDKFDQWYYKDNTFSERINRWLRLAKHCQEIGFKIIHPHDIFLYGWSQRYKHIENINLFRSLNLIKE